MSAGLLLNLLHSFCFSFFFLQLLIANSTSDFRFPFFNFLPLRVAALCEGLLSSNFLSRGKSAVSSSTFLSLVNSLPLGRFLIRLKEGGSAFSKLLLIPCCGSSLGISGLDLPAWFLKRENKRNSYWHKDMFSL